MQIVFMYNLLQNWTNQELSIKSNIKSKETAVEKVIKIDLFTMIRVLYDYNFIQMQSSQSQTVASKTVEWILKATQQRIIYKKLIKEVMPHYSAAKVINVVNQLGGQLLVEDPQARNCLFTIDWEPKPLQKDCLLPISAQICTENQYLKIVAEFVKQEELRTNRRENKSAVIEKDPNQSPYIQLNLQVQGGKQDGLINQLRKNKELVFKKIQDQELKMQRRIEEQARSSKKKQKGKEEKINFDYNGNIIKVKSDSKPNLITDTMRSVPSKNTLKHKEVNKKPQPSDVNVKSNKRDEKKKNRRFDQIQFSEIKTLLADFAISKGSKINHNKTVLEDKKKRMSIPEIKRSLSTNRITKVDYFRLKEATLPTEQQSLANNGETARTQEGGLKRRSLSEMSIQKNIKGKIVVSNETLKETYLTKITTSLYDFPEQASSSRVEEPEADDRLKLDDNDLYNITYMKGNGKQAEGNQIIKFPRISVHSKNIDSKEPNPPKNREKVKDGSLVRIELRKRFEDKLRI